ncbi:MAG: AsmA family protein, partial [Cyclonatronaceae bacterium]
MKLFLKIAGGLLALLIVMIIALSFYLTDERLKSMIMPELNELTGREIQVERISYSLFRSFPSFSLIIEDFSVPDTDADADDDVLASVDELLLAVELFPLLSGGINITQLDVDRPVFNYVMYEDGRTNLDSLLAFMNEQQEPAPAQQEQTQMQVDLQAVSVRNGDIGYYDRSSATVMNLNGLSADISLSYGQQLSSDIDAAVEGLSISLEGDPLLRNLPVSVSQRSVIDLERERVSIEQGQLSIRGLEMDMSGQVADYSADAPFIDLTINSSSENFGALLDAVPDSYKQELEGVETRGALVLGAKLNGRFGENQMPDFEVVAGVEDGFLKYPDVDSAIEAITLDMRANNDEVVVQSFSARAAGNDVNAEGVLNRPLEENADFDFSMDLELDLSTVQQFYPLEDMELRGQLSMDGSTQGRLDDVENARFSAIAQLEDGFVKYLELDEPIRDMNMAVNANQTRIIIQSFSARAAENRLNLSGTIRQPLQEDRSSFQLVADAYVDLASVPKFYLIDTDTLDMRG